ncbi:MAG: TolC family protein, partial [Candidatus Contendobacter sp.]|nr:TolC family protein [Candidatus Contendobacter sp.]
MPDADFYSRHLRADPRISNPAMVGWLLLALSGCASIAPQPTDPVAVAIPAAWSGAPVSATADPTALMQWWSRFNDPLLSGLVGQALQANLNIKSAEAALQQARALRDVTAAALWPTVDGSGLAQRSRADSHSANWFKVGLDASWELDFFGVNRSALAAS